jgi:hypothetical protein
MFNNLGASEVEAASIKMFEVAVASIDPTTKVIKTKKKTIVINNVYLFI